MRGTTRIVLSGLLIACAGCGGPDVVLVRSLRVKNRDPVQLAEDVHAKVYVPLEDGTTVLSKKRVRLPAGGWYMEFDPNEDE